jgi:6-pyruvoyltetrahydropterin/6-carboxytetrahydropterin synthase
MRTTTKLILFKENFKFSSAHFLIFNPQTAEMLHGHNYQVRVEIPVQGSNQEQGYYIDFHVLKGIIKSELDRWDEHVLLPALHPEVKTKKIKSTENSRYKTDSLEVQFRERFYVFPLQEACLLDVNNTSVENLSQLLAQNILQKLKALGVSQLSVFVEETKGQGASTKVSL